MKINPIRQKAYKCVSVNEHGQFASWAGAIRHSNFNVIYTPNTLIKAPIGELMVFDTLENATKYYDDTRTDYSDVAIWEVEAYKAKPLKSIIKWEVLSEDYIEQFWNQILKYYFTTPPLGTLGCKSLKMLRKIKENLSRNR
jgi:hypothetical protein